MEQYELDKKDRAILQALDDDVRASYTQIGKKTKLAKETVQYRIKRLESKGIITGYWAVPKISADTHVYKLLLKNKSLGATQRKTFITFCTEHRAVSWFAATQGSWDFVISSYSKDTTAFFVFVQELLDRFGHKFKEKAILRAVAATTLQEKYLHTSKKQTKVVQDNFLDQPSPVDKVQQQILSILGGDARASFTQIGKELQLTPEAIGQRFRQISHANMIKDLKPRINHQAIGLEYYHLFISIQDYTKRKAMIEYYAQHPACVFIMEHIGAYDLHLELVMPAAQMQGVINDLGEHFGEAINGHELLHITQEFMMRVKT